MTDNDYERFRAAVAKRARRLCKYTLEFDRRFPGVRLQKITEFQERFPKLEPIAPPSDPDLEDDLPSASLFFANHESP